MMLRAAALALMLANAPAAGQTVAEDAARASAALQEAIAALDTAQGARDRVAALTETIRAYEAGLAALREGLRQSRLRETALTLRFDSESARLGQILAVLAQVEQQPGPLLLLHPSGPLGTARSGMILSDVTPALQAEAARLRAELTELRDLRALQDAAAATLAQGLSAAQTARTALSQAIGERTDLPRRLTDDAEALNRLVSDAETLAAFADGLAPDPGASADFATAQGTLALPVLGAVLRRAGEADANGVRRPGIALSTRPNALVTAPWAATIRYVGPLLDYGNVMILEPGQDYLLVLSGLGTLYGQVGDVVAQGAPLGLMGGVEQGPDEFLLSVRDGGGARETETLYMELRQGAEPVDPAPWFAATRE
jgi:murein hydrolase activator